MLKSSVILFEYGANPFGYELFVDLDGVLVNFHKKAMEVTGIDDDGYDKDAKLRKDFWRAIKEYCNAGNKFFEVMEPMPDAEELWEYVSKYRPKILSATGYVGNAKVEKRVWARNHLGHETADSAILVRTASDKAVHATPKRILIDDRSKALDPWIAAGGIGIHHKTAAGSISKLKELGL